MPESEQTGQEILKGLVKAQSRLGRVATIWLVIELIGLFSKKETRRVLQNDGRRHCRIFLSLSRVAAERTRLLPSLAALLDPPRQTSPGR